jgi:IS30 family transposase
VKVYQHVYADKAKGGMLHKGLPSQGISCTCAGATGVGRFLIAALSVIVPGTLKDASRYVIVKTLRSIALVSQAIKDVLKPLNARVKTLTVDNGKKYAYHQMIDTALGIQSYFADPYCIWQRRSNENFNCLLHQYNPKTHRMETVTDEELTMIKTH